LENRVNLTLRIGGYASRKIEVATTFGRKTSDAKAPIAVRTRY